MTQLENLTDEYTLLIDLDGTLIDTDDANFVSYQKAISEIINININYLDNERFTRKTLKKSIPTLSPLEFNKIIDLKDRLFSKNLNLTNLNISLLNLIKKYTKRNRIVLATNSHKARAISLLEYYNIVDLFDYIFFKEDFEKINENNKIQYVLKHIKINPKTLIVFENEQCVINEALLFGILDNNIYYNFKGVDNE